MRIVERHRSTTSWPRPGVLALVAGCQGLIRLDLGLDGSAAPPAPAAAPPTHLPTHYIYTDYCEEITDRSLAALGASVPRLQSLLLTGGGGPSIRTHAQGVTRHLTHPPCFVLIQRMHMLCCAGCVFVTDAGVAAVASGCRGLSEMALAGLSITDEALHALAAGCRSLVDLDLSLCDCITVGAVAALLAACPAMRRVSVAECDRITESDLQELHVYTHVEEIDHNYTRLHG